MPRYPEKPVPKYLGKPGAQIKSLDELCQAVENKRAVVGWLCRPQPAACIINLSGRTLQIMFSRGLFIYEKPRKERKNAKCSETGSEEKDG